MIAEPLTPYTQFGGVVTRSKARQPSPRSRSSSSRADASDGVRSAGSVIGLSLATGEPEGLGVGCTATADEGSAAASPWVKRATLRIPATPTRIALQEVARRERSP